MIDYETFKLIYKCVHIDRLYQFENLLNENHWNYRFGSKVRFRIGADGLEVVAEGLKVVQMV